MHFGARTAVLLAGRPVPASVWAAAFMAAQSDGVSYDFVPSERVLAANGPVATGDVMRLVLDNRQWPGLTLARAASLQPEIITDPTFNTATNWTLTAPTASIADGRLTFAPGTAEAQFKTGTTLFGANKHYWATFGIPASDANFGLRLRERRVVGGAGAYNLTANRLSGPALASGYWTTTGDYAAVLSSQFPVGATGYFYLDRVSGHTGSVSVDNLSLREITGHHATQETTSFQPKLTSAGAEFDGNDDRLLTGYVPGPGANFMIARLTLPAVLPQTGAVQIAVGARTTAGARAYIGVFPHGRPLAGVGGNGHEYGPDLRGQTIVVGWSCDGTTVRCFVGDAPVHEVAQTGSLTTTQPVFVGAINENGSAANFFTGSVARVVAGRQFLDRETYLKIKSALEQS